MIKISFLPSWCATNMLPYCLFADLQIAKGRTKLKQNKHNAIKKAKKLLLQICNADTTRLTLFLVSSLWRWSAMAIGAITPLEVCYVATKATCLIFKGWIMDCWRLPSSAWDNTSQAVPFTEWHIRSHHSSLTLILKKKLGIEWKRLCGG